MPATWTPCVSSSMGAPGWGHADKTESCTSRWNVAGAENLIDPGRRHFDHRGARAAAGAGPQQIADTLANELPGLHSPRRLLSLHSS